MNPVVHVNSDAFLMNPAAVYVGRPISRHRDRRVHRGSAFGNPFRIADHPLGHYTDDDLVKLKIGPPGMTYVLVNAGGQAVNCYRLWMAHRLRPDSVFRGAHIAALRGIPDGVPLGCWCRLKGNEPCHGDVVAELADRVRRGELQ